MSMASALLECTSKDACQMHSYRYIKQYLHNIEDIYIVYKIQTKYILW